MADYFDNGGISEDFKIARSKTVKGVVPVGTHNMIRIPKGAFLKDVWVEITTACVAGTALDVSVGFSGNKETADPDYFMINDDADFGNTGMRRASQSATPFEGKRFLDGSGAVTVTLETGSNLTAGSFTVFAEYSTLWG